LILFSDPKFLCFVLDTTGLITRPKSMRQALTFASSWPALVSLDLTAWDSFSDSVPELLNWAAQDIAAWILTLALSLLQLVKHLPETLESLNVSYTGITNRGTSPRLT
jgi:hypothetical protein